MLFGKGFDETAVKSLDISTINLLKGELQVVQLPMEKWNSGSLIVDILTEDAKIFASKGDAKRAIQGNALQINRVRISELSSVTSSDQIFANKYVFVENGKKQKVLVELI